MICAGLGTFVTYNPTTASPDTELSQAMRLMDQHCFRHLPVVDEDRLLVGVISDLDVARALLAQRAWASHLPAGQAAQVCLVRDVLVRAPMTVELEESPLIALQTIIDKGFHSLPVVQQGKLVGILTSTDYLREMSYGGVPGFRNAISGHMSDGNMSISVAASIDEAGEAMQQGGREHLVVTNGEFPMGIVSLRDVRRAAQTGIADVATLSSHGSVRKLLTREAATIPDDGHLGDAACQMIEQRTKALAVIDSSNHLRGLLTEDDLLAAIVRDWTD